MSTNFFCTNFLNTPRGPGHPGKISGTSQIPLFETQGRQSFEGGHEVFDHHPFEWKTPSLRTQKVYLCALFSSLILVRLKSWGWGSVPPFQFLNTARSPGHPGKIPGTSQLPFLETQLLPKPSRKTSI